MDCPIHETTLRPSDHEDGDGVETYDVACPECRQAWSSRGELYELPPRHHADLQVSEPD